MRFLTYIICLICISVFPQSKGFERVKSQLSPSLRNKDFVLTKTTKAYYILSATDGQGYIIMSTNHNVDNNILGYSETEEWNEKIMPPALLQWLDYLEENYLPKGKSIIKPNSNKRVDVPILMTSKWHQDSPYNDLCPIIADGNIKTAAGCVAIASAQVAYYWRKDNPQFTAYDTPIYPYGKAPVTYSIPAGTNFQWNLMRDFYTLYESDEEKEAVARLVYLIGTSTYLNYGTSTGGQINDIIAPFSKQLNLNAKYASKKNYSQEEWELLVYDNLKKNRPVVYAGAIDNSGHAVVIDGYDANLNLYHFNFGWGGNGDGYYTINDLTGMNGYTEGQECIYDIYPRQRNISITIESPEVLCLNTPGHIEMSIQNNSTFNIKDLYLFVSNTIKLGFEKNESVWNHIGNIENDGSEFTFSIDFTPKYSGAKSYLTLTDGEMNILTQRIISIEDVNSIYEVNTSPKNSSATYSINGMSQHDFHKGIKIKEGKKVLFK